MDVKIILPKRANKSKEFALQKQEVIICVQV